MNGVPEQRPPKSWEAMASRTVDLLLASIGLLVLAPLMVAIAVAIRLTSRGPALFRQRRVGMGRVPFTMYKFRTMRVGSGDEALRELIARELAGEKTSVNGSCKLASDPRVTRVGAVLRRTSVDELPQLINVLRGEMALVGPRPCLEWEADMFPAEFADRFSVRPGLTGLWQVSGRSTVHTIDMLHLDVQYAHGRDLWGDLALLARTVPTLIRGDGAR